MYGDRNFRKRGVLGVVMRLEDKVARLDTLIEAYGGQDEDSVEISVEEGLDDAFKDIAGYAVAALMLIEGTWEDNGNV
tara:strand:+ start:287 stop:520 length:234 start_codon:yes stop_codon:yes gene_type:complete